MIRNIAFCVVLAAVALGSPSALAQTSAETRAWALSKQAQTHYRSGQYEQAAKLYQRAHAAHPAAVFLYSTGLCYFKLQRYGLALSFLERFTRAAQTGLNPAYLRYAKKFIGQIKSTTRLITIRVNEVGAKVIVDRRAAVLTPLKSALRLRHGSHTLTVTKTGYQTARRRFVVFSGSSTVISVTMQRIKVAPVVRRRTPTVPVTPPIKGTRPRPTVLPGPERNTIPLENPNVAPRTTTQPRGTTPRPETDSPKPQGARRGKGWLWLGVTGVVLALAGEGMAWGMWGGFEGGGSADKKWPGYLYYTGHSLAGIGAGLAILGLAMYFAKSKKERAQKRSSRLLITPVLSVGKRGAYGGLGGTF